MIESSPDRFDVEIEWIALIDAKLTREEVHAWASRWVEGHPTQKLDVMILNALQQLHGFDLKIDDDDGTTLRHGGEGRYLHSLAHMRSAFEEWKENCKLYDADPGGYARRAVNRARVIVNREQN